MIMNLNPIQNIRRHHAVEHASLSIIQSKIPAIHLAGYSDPQGFWVVGEVDTDKLLAAVDEAITRLQAGEKSLAIHPNCGTNFAATGLVAGSLAWLGMVGINQSFKKQLDRWPMVITLVTFGLIASQPLGPYLQANYTTDANIGPMKVKEIVISKRGAVKVHRFKLGQ
jgi:hypothetical protein